MSHPDDTCVCTTGFGRGKKSILNTRSICSSVGDQYVYIFGAKMVNVITELLKDEK